MAVLLVPLLLISGPARAESPQPTPVPQDLVELTLSAADQHQAYTKQRFDPIRQQLVESCRSLERALGGDSQFARNWKKYLKWDLLEPQLEPGAKVDRTGLENLETVQRRLRANQPGLELPVFTRVADALDRYREAAFWHALAERRDTAPIYAAYLKGLGEQLRRHQEAATVETTRQVGKAVGSLELLGDAPELVEAIRASYSQPNAWGDISTQALNKLAAPVCQIRPVRDCILGATIRGTAITNGQVTFQPIAADDRIEMDIHLAGLIHSQTQAYRKPVRVSSSGVTDYTASKRLFISDESFATAGYFVDAHTHTRVNSVQKMGGKLGKRLIEKIAWKKVYESKAQSEHIAARHAECQIADNFNRQVAEALGNGRASYVSKLRDPLKRTDLLAAPFYLASSSGGLHTQATLATNRQITTNTLPPLGRGENDITVQLHESAVNNFLPTVLGGATLHQERADEPAQLEGQVPPWLKKLAKTPPKELMKKVGQQARSAAPTPAKEGPAFRPWRFTLNSEAPASVSFQDQKLILRMRLSELEASGEEDSKPMKNWDFIVTYRVTQQGNEVVLRREGEIEAFPTGFDPQWDKQLTGEQVGIRNNLAKNLNKRAAAGEGFPTEITIPAIELPLAAGRQVNLELAQLVCDHGWLSLGYRVK